jgi:hypothetical protein
VTTAVPLISIRPKDVFNTAAVRIPLEALRARCYTASQDMLVEVIWGATLTAPTFNSAGADSLVEFDVAASAHSGGIVVASTIVPAGTTATLDLANLPPLALDVAGAHPTAPYTDALTVVATQMTAGSACSASIEWAECRC